MGGGAHGVFENTEQVPFLVSFSFLLLNTYARGSGNVGQGRRSGKGGLIPWLWETYAAFFSGTG